MFKVIVNSKFTAKVIIIIEVTAYQPNIFSERKPFQLKNIISRHDLGEIAILI